MMKSDLADATMQGGGGSVNRLSHDELKQLFNLDLGPECSTRKLLESSKAGQNVVWLQLQGADGSSSSSGDGLPPPLAAAVAAGAVTAVNRERQQQSEDAAVEEPAVQAAPAAAAAAAGMSTNDVEALEVEDDW
jgi:hypothetical protein